MMHWLSDVFAETAVITTMVLLLMMLIEFVHVRTQGKGIAVMDRKPHWQILISALLGLTPGCAGVFAVVSLYTHNIVGFGALLAACIASFGDEAFFMLSLMPEKAIAVGGVLFVNWRFRGRSCCLRGLPIYCSSVRLRFSVFGLLFCIVV